MQNMYYTGGIQLRCSKVMRYKNSGRLIVHGGDGYYLDLDKNLQFTSREPHKVNQSTELEDTDWFIEYELEGRIDNRKWRYIRSYSAQEVSFTNTSDLTLPLEDRLNISPSELFNADESIYIGDEKSPGSWKTRAIVTIVLSSIFYYIHTYIGFLSFIVGLILSVKQLIIEKRQKEEIRIFNKGVAERKVEVLEAKKRVRFNGESKIDEILSQFQKWKYLDGQSFEKAIARLFKKKGYSVEYTPTSNDGGIDLLLTKGLERIGVQCKAYNKNVGVAAVRELHGVKSQWSDLNRFMLVSLHGFSRQAREFAEQYNIELFSIEKDVFNIG